MIKKICHIDFEDGRYLDIELIDNPLVEMWIEQHKLNAKFTNRKFASFTSKLFNHAASKKQKTEGTNKFHSNKRIQSVGKINEAVDIIKDEFGLEFPYRAFNGMSWINTNQIHRCFTSAEISLTNWSFLDDYSRNDLLEFKYSEKLPQDFFTNLKPHFNIESKNIKRFVHLIEQINCWVHNYENSKFSEFAELIINSIKKIDDICYLNIDFDVLNERGSCDYHVIPMPLKYQKYCDYDPEEYDVYFLKSITGKDYVQALQELDDPMQWDITNMGNITGGLNIFPSKLYAKIWDMPIPQNWLKIHNVPVNDMKLFRPPVLGKILNKDWFDCFHLIKSDSNKKDNSGYKELCNEYGHPVNIEIE